MICPRCGLDIGKFEQERTSRQEKANKEKRFEKLYGPLLGPIRKKRALVGGVLGFTVGALLTLIIFWLSFLFSNEVFEFFSGKFSEKIW